MSIDTNILQMICPTCNKMNMIVYKTSVPLKFQCQHCDKIINVFQEKDSIEQTRVRVGNIEKEDR